MEDHFQGEPDTKYLRSQVPLETFGELKLRDEDVDCCVICLDAITERCELNPCRHSDFHHLCITEWLDRKPRCPLCKAKVVEINHGPDDARVRTPLETVRGHRRSHLVPSVFLSIRSRVQFLREYPPRAQAHRTYPRSQQDDSDLEAAIERRALIYAHGRFSKHVGSNSISRYRDFTPAMFNSDDALVSRARMWMRRELQVFPWISRNDEPPSSSSPARAHLRSPPPRARSTIERLRQHNATYLLEFVIAMLKTVDIKGSSGQAEDMLSDYLGIHNARLFLHELTSWLRSPCVRLEDWDRMVQYDPIPTTIGGPATAYRSNSYRRGRRPARDRSRTRRHEQARRAGSLPLPSCPSARCPPGTRPTERWRRPGSESRALNRATDLRRHADGFPLRSDYC